MLVVKCMNILPAVTWSLPHLDILSDLDQHLLPRGQDLLHPLYVPEAGPHDHPQGRRHLRPGRQPVDRLRAAGEVCQHRLEALGRSEVRLGERLTVGSSQLTDDS